MKNAVLVLTVFCFFHAFGQYTVTSIPFSPLPMTGTDSTLEDDTYSAPIDIGFDFCFYDSTYNQCVVGVNGIVSFNLAYANGYCPWSFVSSIPSSTLPLNTIMGPYHDIDNSIGGAIRCYMTGTSPNRKFVVSYDSIPMFDCNSLLATSQIILYESTNIIEVHILSDPICFSWNSGNSAVGIQDSQGTMGDVAPGRNTGPWTTTNEAWRFTPSNSCTNGINELSKPTITLVRITDIMGREIADMPNTLLIYVYSDGTTEKVFRAMP